MPPFDFHPILTIEKNKNFFGLQRSPWFLLLKCNATSSPIAAKTNTMINGIQNHGRRGTGNHLTSSRCSSLSKRHLDKKVRVNKEKDDTPTKWGLVASCLVANLRSLSFSNACCVPVIEASNLSPEEQRIPSTYIIHHNHKLAQKSRIQDQRQLTHKSGVGVDEALPINEATFKSSPCRGYAILMERDKRQKERY